MSDRAGAAEKVGSEAAQVSAHHGPGRPPLSRHQKLRFALVFAMNVFIVYSQQVSGPVQIFVFTQFFNRHPGPNNPLHKCDSTEQMNTDGCIRSLATYGQVSAWQNAVQGLLSFLITPVWGKLSDSFGRRPLINLSIAIVVAQTVSIVLSQPPFGGSLWIYIALTTLPGGLYSSVAAAFVADVMQPEWRAVAFGVLSGTWGLGQATGPLVNLLPFQTYILPLVVSACSASCGLLFSICCLPESLTAENTVRMSCETMNSFRNLSVLWYGPKSISSKILFRRLAFCVCVNAMLLDGIFSVWTLYVRDQFDFTRQQGTYATLSFGIGRVIVLFFLLKPLLDAFGEKGTLLIGLFANLAFTMYYALFITTAWSHIGPICVYAGSGILSFGAVCYPAIATIKSSKCPADEQGRVLGALNGMQMMAWGLGPMIFNNIFAWLIDKQAMAAFAERFGWQPPVSLVWYIGVLLSIIAIALAFSIPDPRTVTVDVRPASAVKPEPVQNSEEWDNKIGRNTSAHNKVAKPAGPPAGARLCDQLMWRMQCKTDHTRARRMSDRVGLLQ